MNIDEKNIIENIPHSEYPRPQFRREKFICLNGKWRFAIRKAGAPLGNYDKEIIVPFSPETKNSGLFEKISVTATDRLYYGRDFSVPNGWLSGLTVLYFSAVDYSCDVYVNGKLAGSHEGGYTMFQIDISRFLTEGENSLDVVVSDSTEGSEGGRGKQKTEHGGIWYTPQSGIWGTVWLENMPATHINSFTIVPEYKEKTVNILFDCDEKILYEVFDRDKKILSGSAYKTLSLKYDFESWSPENPKLYDVTFTCGEDKVYSYFAMREFTIVTDKYGKKRLGLNGKPYFFSGVLDQGYWSDGLLTPPSDYAVYKELKTVKEMGFNTIRKHIKIENMRWYYHCDRLGLIVWQDFVNGGGEYSFSHIAVLPFLNILHNDKDYSYFSRSDEKGRKRFIHEWQDTVEQLKNCASIYMWTIFNEGWGQFDSEKIAHAVKQTDKTRIVESVSGWHDYKKKCDIKSMHTYYTPLKVPRDARPVTLSEFGGYSFKIDGHVYDEHKSFGYKKFKSQEKYLLALKKLYIKKVAPLISKGLSGCIYTQLSDVEEEINGLITYDRKVIKVPIEEIKKLNDVLQDTFKKAVLQ